MTLSSPNGHYEVRVSGDFGTPSKPFTKYRVQLLVKLKDKIHVGPITLHEADALDTAFSDRYRSPVWGNESTLQFKSAIADTTASDKLIVRNRSGRAIQYVLAKVGDMVLLLDVKDGETVQLPVTAQRNVTTVWVGAQAMLADGTILDYQGADFEPAKPEPTGAAQYSLEIIIDVDRISVMTLLPNGEQSKKISELKAR
jgi:hypothetical protein